MVPAMVSNSHQQQIAASWNITCPFTVIVPMMSNLLLLGCSTFKVSSWFCSRTLVSWRSQRQGLNPKLKPLNHGDSLRRPLTKQIVWAIILSFSVDHPTCLVSLSAFGTPTMLICAACWFDPSSDLNSCSANGCWLNVLVDLHHLAPTLRSSLGPNPTRSPIAISLPLWDLGFSRTDFSI